MVWAQARKVFRDYNNYIAKDELPAQQLLLKTLLKRCWPKYLGNYTDYTDGRYFAVLLLSLSLSLSIYIFIYTHVHYTYIYIIYIYEIYILYGYILNADGHLLDQFPGRYRVLIFQIGFKQLRYIFLLRNKFFLVLN